MEGDTNGWQPDPMRYYRSKRDAAHQTVASKYKIVGFISSGTYGRVYKAVSKDSAESVHAIKKFKPDKEGDVVTYTGISQSAIREITVRPRSCTTRRHPDYALS
jgi:cyclin-dependent kinase 8/11